MLGLYAPNVAGAVVNAAGDDDDDDDDVYAVQLSQAAL